MKFKATLAIALAACICNFHFTAAHAAIDSMDGDNDQAVPGSGGDGTHGKGDGKGATADVGSSEVPTSAPDEIEDILRGGGPGHGGGNGGGGFHPNPGPAPVHGGGNGGGGFHPPAPGPGPQPGHGGGHGPGPGPGHGGGGFNPGPGHFHHDPYPVHGGFYPWPHWGHPFFPRPIFGWNWGAVLSVTCTAEDSYGDLYPVTEDGYIGNVYEGRIDQIEDAALDRCFSETDGDTGCHLDGCEPTY